MNISDALDCVLPLYKVFVSLICGRTLQVILFHVNLKLGPKGRKEICKC